MKNCLFIFLAFIFSVFISSCTVKSAPNDTLESNKLSSVQESYTYNFKEYGFTLTAPCKLNDVSSKASGNFLVNYGGITDQNDRNKIAAYQLIVVRIPVGYKDLPKAEFDSKIDEKLRSTFSEGMTNLTPIKFGYEGYKGYVGECTHQGMKQKGVFFRKDDYLIALTVITNNDLEAKFNSFTNGFKSIN